MFPSIFEAPLFLVVDRCLVFIRVCFGQVYAPVMTSISLMCTQISFHSALLKRCTCTQTFALLRLLLCTLVMSHRCVN